MILMKAGKCIQTVPEKIITQIFVNGRKTKTKEKHRNAPQTDPCPIKKSYISLYLIINN